MLRCAAPVGMASGSGICLRTKIRTEHAFRLSDRAGRRRSDGSCSNRTYAPKTANDPADLRGDLFRKRNSARMNTGCGRRRRGTHGACARGASGRAGNVSGSSARPRRHGGQTFGKYFAARRERPSTIRSRHVTGAHGTIKRVNNAFTDHCFSASRRGAEPSKLKSDGTAENSTIKSGTRSARGKWSEIGTAGKRRGHTPNG
jgi:hypothetical protein